MPLQEGAFLSQENMINNTLLVYINAVPISVYVFTLPLPYLGVASSLPTGFVAGAIILVTGLLIYAWTPSGSTAALPSPSN